MERRRPAARGPARPPPLHHGLPPARPPSPANPFAQIRRRMDEENKKARRAARREYVDTVRELAAFVRKRDKRLVKIQVRAADSDSHVGARA